jgi:hypothetical protein
VVKLPEVNHVMFFPFNGIIFYSICNVPTASRLQWQNSPNTDVQNEIRIETLCPALAYNLPFQKLQIAYLK